MLALIDHGLELHTLDAHDLRVLDLRSDSALNQVGLTTDDIADEDWTACQAVGHAAYFLDYDGVLAPSASGLGLSRRSNPDWPPTIWKSKSLSYRRRRGTASVGEFTVRTYEKSRAPGPRTSARRSASVRCRS